MTQGSAQLIEVGEWSVDEDFPIFPIGSKPKRLLRCPEQAPQPFLIPGHPYLFKVAHDWRSSSYGRRSSLTRSRQLLASMFRLALLLSIAERARSAL
jgi:hypothetical protein